MDALHYRPSYEVPACQCHPKMHDRSAGLCYFPAFLPPFLDLTGAGILVRRAEVSLVARSVTRASLQPLAFNLLAPFPCLLCLLSSLASHRIGLRHSGGAGEAGQEG